METSVDKGHIQNGDSSTGASLHRVNEKLREVLIEQKRIQEDFIQRSALIEDDIRIAAEFQQAVLPTFPELDYVNAEIIYQPHSTVSGDVYDFLLNREGELGVFLGDATGHGIAAALMTMMVHIGLEGIRRDLPTHEYTRRLNKLIAARQTNRSVTSVFFRIKPNGELSVTHAGHPSIIIIPADGSDPVQFEKGGCPLGIFAEEPVPYDEEHYQLKPGDRIFTYTDAVTEWRNKEKQDFGLNKLLGFLIKHRQSSLQSLSEQLLVTLRDYAKEEECGDDLTTLIIDYTGT